MKSGISWSRVAGSNLASSSKDETHPSGWVLFIIEPSKNVPKRQFVIPAFFRSLLTSDNFHI